MSVMFAPRARMAVNASWPGVSMNVIMLAVALHDRRADVLRDAAGLGGHDAGLADGVEQRRLAVVDVAHDGDDRRARLEVGRVVLEDEALLLGGDDLNLDAEVLGEDLHRIAAHRLVHRVQVAQQHEALDDLARA